MSRFLPLKRVSNITYGLGQPPPLADDGIPIIRATNISRGRIVRSGLIFAEVQNLPLGRAPLLQADEILVVRSGADTGDSARVTDEREGAAPGYDLRITPHSIDSRFLGYALLSRHAVDQMVVASSRAAQPHLNAEELGEVLVWQPDAATKRAIADYLDAETARIDALIAKKRRLVEVLGERDASLVDAVFGPAPGERLVRLARMATIQTGLTLDSARPDGADMVTLPYLRVANVQHGRLDLGEVKEVTVPLALARRCRLRTGDVLMTEDGDLDKLGRGTVWQGELPECLHQNHVFAVRPDPSRLLPDYLAMITRTSHARAYFESTGTRSTNLASTNSFKVLDFPIPDHPVDEQRVALNTYVLHSEPVSGCQSRLLQQITLLQEHRQALITAAVTGELAVLGVAT